MVNNDVVWAVVPAAGIGSRMQTDRPKQYLYLKGKTVLERTLERLASHPRIEGIVLALAEHDPWWSNIVHLSNDYQIRIVTGGKCRADSVLNALSKLTTLTGNNALVLVHDAARPCLRHQDIDTMLEEPCKHQSGVVLGIPVNDTVKRVKSNNEIRETVCRQGLWRASTPQIFNLQALMQALKTAKLQQSIVPMMLVQWSYLGFNLK